MIIGTWGEPKFAIELQVNIKGLQTNSRKEKCLSA